MQRPPVDQRRLIQSFLRTWKLYLYLLCNYTGALRACYVTDNPWYVLHACTSIDLVICLSNYSWLARVICTWLARLVADVWWNRKRLHNALARWWCCPEQHNESNYMYTQNGQLTNSTRKTFPLPEAKHVSAPGNSFHNYYPTWCVHLCLRSRDAFFHLW